MKNFTLLKRGSSENQYDLAAWKPPILIVVDRFRQLFAQFRRPLSPEDLADAPERLQIPTFGSKVFWYLARKDKK